MIGHVLFAGRARRVTLAALTVVLSTAQFFVPGLVAPAGAAGLSTNFFDYANHDVATTTQGLVDWANNGSGSRYALSPDEVIARSLPRPIEHARATACFELGQRSAEGGELRG